MIVSADEIVVRFVSHVGGRYRDILVTGDIDAFRIIHLIISSGSDRESRYVAFAVVEYGHDVRREYRLRMIVNRHRGIGPPEERLRFRRAVVQLSVDFQVRFVRV